MTAKKAIKLKTLSLILGAVVLLTALLLFIADFTVFAMARKKSDLILSSVEKIISEPISAFPEERVNNTMSSMQIEGVNIIGIIEMPQYDLKIPVCPLKQTGNIKMLPHRVSGSVYDFSMVVDASGFFDSVTELEVNNVLYFTDMEGNRYTYLLSAIKHADEVSAEILDDEQTDLTVFVKPNPFSDYIIAKFCLKR